MSYNKQITKKDLDHYLKEVAREYKRKNAKRTPVEIILIGGAAALVNYGFRAMTYDVDAIISGQSLLKDAIHVVGEKYNLPYGWFNSDFMKTSSYSVKLINKSKYYKTCSNIVTYRTVTAEYLVAMKMKAGRMYKHDLSDIVGIIQEHKVNSNPLTFEKIEFAVCELYGSMDEIKESVIELVKEALVVEDGLSLYQETQISENVSKEELIEFNEKNPNVLTGKNAEEVLKELKKKQ